MTADLRQRIANAIASVTITIGPNSLALLKAGNTLGLTGGEIDAMALSALAVVQPELDQLRSENADLHGRLDDIEALCDHAESTALAPRPTPHPVPQWATDARAICRRAPVTVPAPPEQRPGCPDPIECNHEAAAGQALAEADQLRAELDRARAQLAGLWPCVCSHLPDAHRYDSALGRNFCWNCKPDGDLHNYEAAVSAPTT